MRKFLLALLGLAVVAVPIVAITAPANAASTSTSTAPTMYAPNVARGHTIPVRINAHGSKVLSRSNTLWKSGHRVYDWSPKPGLYKVKSVIRYQTKTTTRTTVVDPDCLSYDYTEQECRDMAWTTTKSTSKYNRSRLVTRYDYARVALDETPGCVSGAEFNAVRNGMTQAKVHSIFGTRGWVESSGSGGTNREYVTCEGNEWSYVEVDFDPRVWWKWRYIDWS
jgi:hypothetical protein